LTISFTPGDDGGEPILHNEWKFASDSGWNNINLDTSFNVTGLTNGDSYTIDVRSVNGNGNGVSATTTGTPGLVPEPPTNLNDNGTGTTTNVTIEFTPGYSYGLAVTGYQYSLDNGSYSNQLLIINANSVFISFSEPITAGQHYITLKEGNAIGYSNPSPTLEFTANIF